MKKKNKSKAAIGILIFLIAIAAVFSVVKTVKAENLKKVFAEQMSLGERYLLEHKYEEAIIAFNLAIEIDPRNVDSYLKLSDAYAGTGNYEGAVTALEKGFELTQDDRLMEAMENYKRLIEFAPVFNKLAEMMEQADRDAVWDYQAEDEYQRLVETTEEVISYPLGDNIYLLIYPCGHCYYGTMKDGKRSGHGIWADYDYADRYSSFYEGEWSEDYPEGVGKYWTVCHEVMEDLFIDEGTWKAGLEHGRIDCVYTSNYGGEVYSDKNFHISEEGIPAEVADLHPEGERSVDGIEFYCMYSDEENSEYAVKGRKYGIKHAKKGVDDSRSMIKRSEEGGEE